MKLKELKQKWEKELEDLKEEGIKLGLNNDNNISWSVNKINLKEVRIKLQAHDELMKAIGEDVDEFVKIKRKKKGFIDLSDFSELKKNWGFGNDE